MTRASHLKKDLTEYNMKSALIAIALLAIAPFARASAIPPGYVSVINSKNIETDLLSVYKMKTGTLVGAETNIAILSHSDKTTLMPQFLMDKGIAPIPWVFSIGAGGSLSGNAFVNANISANWTSFTATTITNWTGRSSNPYARGVTDFFTQGLALPNNDGTLGFSGGIGIGGQLVNEGHFQNFAAAFPGRGFNQVVSNNAVYTLGLTWKTL